MHDTNNDTPIYRDISGDGDEFRRALKHACAGFRPPGALVFHAGEQSWNAFYTGVFASTLSHHFTRAYSAAGAGEIDRVIDLDEGFATGLEPAQRQRICDASGIVFEARAGASGLRLLDRLRERAPNGTFTTAFAAHAASFNVPLLHAAIAYLAVEWRAGNAAAGLGLENPRGWDKVFTGKLLAAPEPIRQILASCMRGWADVA